MATENQSSMLSSLYDSLTSSSSSSSSSSSPLDSSPKTTPVTSSLPSTPAPLTLHQKVDIQKELFRSNYSIYPIAMSTIVDLDLLVVSLKNSAFDMPADLEGISTLLDALRTVQNHMITFQKRFSTHKSTDLAITLFLLSKGMLVNVDPNSILRIFGADYGQQRSMFELNSILLHSKSLVEKLISRIIDILDKSYSKAAITQMEFPELSAKRIQERTIAEFNNEYPFVFQSSTTLDQSISISDGLFSGSDRTKCYVGLSVFIMEGICAASGTSCVFSSSQILSGGSLTTALAHFTRYGYPKEQQILEEIDTTIRSLRSFDVTSYVKPGNNSLVAKILRSWQSSKRTAIGAQTLFGVINT